MSHAVSTGVAVKKQVGARAGLHEKGMSARLLGLFFFLLCGAPQAPFAVAEEVWTGVQRIVAIGDVHGDYQQFVALLREAGLIDQKNKWTGGKTHLVQTGDILDRGPQSRQVMELLMSLEKEARRAGGRVHALIGNHEAMNLYGDLRYVSPQEYEAFRDRNSEKIRDAFYQQHVEQLKKSSPPGELPELTESYRQVWESKQPLGFFEHRYALSDRGRYGKWILGHNAIIKINDTLFLHGGLSPKYAADSLAGINERVRDELEDFTTLAGGIVQDEEGPLWYRGLALAEEESLAAHVRRVLENYGARRIVVGHTVTEGAVIPRFGGKVVLIDAGLSQFYGARRACLILEGDRAYALHRGKKIALPSDLGAELLQYLQEAAALDPSPSSLPGRIRPMEDTSLVPATR